jgi:hypothetical protein
MKENDNELVQRLNALHKEAEAFRAEQKKASIQIGEALYIKKNELPQREFTAWMKSSLEFDVATAYRYLESFRKAETKKWSGFGL